jgi:hypothetical protein
MKTFVRSTLALGISLALVGAANASVDDMDPLPCAWRMW